MVAHAVWTLTTVEKKNVVVTTTWTKDGDAITHSQGFRWGTWTWEGGQAPVVDLDNPTGYSVYDAEVDWELVSMDDGCWAAWDWGGLDEDLRARIEAGFDEDGAAWLEDHGWTDDTKVVLTGPLSLTTP